MTLAISQLSTSSVHPRVGELLADGTKTQSGGWQDVVAKVSSYMGPQSPKSLTAQDTFKHLSGLMRLQMDITQYQLRVEVVSKVAESAVASLRKLQQPQ